MKIKTWILPSMLAIAVIVSVWLSSSIWINPAHYDRSNQRITSSQSTSNDIKPISSVYAPTQIIETTQQKKQYVVNSQTVNLISEIANQTKNYQGAKMEQLDGNQKDYLNLLNMNNSVALNYPDSISLKIVSNYFNNHFDSLSNVLLNHIVIPFDGSNDLYLLGDNRNKIYRIHVKDNHSDEIKNLIAHDVHKIPVQISMRNQVSFVNYRHAFSMPQYGYLISKASQNYYVTRLLSDAQDVSVKRHRTSTVYNDESSRQITFYNNGEVNYYDSHPGNISTNMTQFLITSYDHISKILLNDNLANVRFFNYDADASRVTYRKYVEGFPIFNQNQYGDIQMRLVDNTSLKYNFSLKSLQIPVPMGRKNIMMPSTKQVLTRLKAYGYNVNNVKGVELGYQWSDVKSSDILVVLEPAWYINYGGRYINYNQMLNHNLQ
jgi:regulatory protein YycH of two-component signal transduction system YycFG